ncbi:MAG: hypothetical protein RID91_13640 [Azospirillaceae bacterium]
MRSINIGHAGRAGAKAMAVVMLSASFWAMTSGASVAAMPEACSAEAQSAEDRFALEHLYRTIEQLQERWRSGGFTSSVDGMGHPSNGGLERRITLTEDGLAELIELGADAYAFIRASQATANQIRGHIERSLDAGNDYQVSYGLESLEIWHTNITKEKQRLRDVIAADEAALRKLRSDYLARLAELRLELVALVGPVAADGACAVPDPLCEVELVATQDEFLHAEKAIYSLSRAYAELSEIDPPEDMPRVTMVRDGNMARLEVHDINRWLVDASAFGVSVSSTLASFEHFNFYGELVSVNPWVNAAANFSAILSQEAAGRHDTEMMPLHEAEELYEEYLDLQSGVTRQEAIRRQSCVMEIARQRINADYLQARALRQDLATGQFGACDGGLYATLTPGELDDTMEGLFSMVSDVNSVVPNFVEDYSGCPVRRER